MARRTYRRTAGPEAWPSRSRRTPRRSALLRAAAGTGTRSRRSRSVRRTSRAVRERRSVGSELRPAACQIEGRRERELRGFEPEPLVGDLVGRVVHRMEGVVAGKGRIVLTIALYQGDRRDTADETEGRGVEDECVGGRQLLDQRRHTDPIALIRLPHAVTERS